MFSFHVLQTRQTFFLTFGILNERQEHTSIGNSPKPIYSRSKVIIPHIDEKQAAMVFGTKEHLWGMAFFKLLSYKSKKGKHASGQIKHKTKHHYTPHSHGPLLVLQESISQGLMYDPWGERSTRG